MLAYAIWIQHDGEIWLHSGWDKITAEDHNPEGYEADLEKARGEYGVDNVRVQEVEIPDDSVEKLFTTPFVRVGPCKKEAVDIMAVYLPAQKIQAIKAIRTKYGYALREAKYFVDYYVEKGEVAFPDSPEFQNYMQPF